MEQWGQQACEVLEVDPERLLKYRFGAAVLDTIITWELAPEGAGTRLTLTQEGFDLDSPLGKQAFGGTKPGWPAVLGRLGAVLDAEMNGRRAGTTYVGAGAARSGRIDCPRTTRGARAAGGGRRGCGRVVASGQEDRRGERSCTCVGRCGGCDGRLDGLAGGVQ